MAFIHDSARIDLHLRGTRAIHVVTAAITAKGEHMITAIEETGTTEKAKATKKPRVGAQGAHVAPKKAKAAKKASPAKKAPKAAKEKGTRERRTTAKVVDL